MKVSPYKTFISSLKKSLKRGVHYYQNEIAAVILIKIIKATRYFRNDRELTSLSFI